MGIPYLWPFVRKKGYEAQLRSQFPQGPVSAKSSYRMDLLGSMFATIRRAFSSGDSTAANRIIESRLRSLQLPQHATILYLDGPTPEEKRTTRDEREARRSVSLAKAHTLLAEMEAILRDGRRLRKQHFKKLHKYISSSFYLSTDLRVALARYLEEKGWTVVECPSEADIQIAIDCKPDDIVISGDSDSLIHPSIKTIWRPQARGGYLEYNVPQLLEKLELSRTGFTALGVVCKNDYTCNIKRMGLVSNYEIIRTLENDKDVDTMVHAYLIHAEVACKHPSITHFEPALRVFGRQEFTVLLEDRPPAEQSFVNLEDISTRLTLLKVQLKENKRSNSAGPDLTREGKFAFNRYNTVDYPPTISPPRHESGKKYTYRQRYAIKTRCRLVEHEPPDVFQQFTWKPWTKPPDLPKSPTRRKPKVTTKDTLSKLPGMSKKDLVKELQWQHPIRILDVGTVNANAARALANESLSLSYLPRIKTCLSEVAQLATSTKRICQQAIGQYLESLSLENLDPMDKLILGQLCDPFTDNDVLIDGSPDEEGVVEDSVDPQEEEEEGKVNETKVDIGKKEEALQFFTSLLSAIYNSTPPKKPAAYNKEPKKESKSVSAVRAFLIKAKAFLPQQDGEAAAIYSSTVVLRSTALHLCTEYKGHYRRGSIDLCKQIRRLKNKGVIPLSTVDNINPKLSPAENFIILNRASGCRRCLSPMSRMDVNYVCLSELELSKIFWHDDQLKLQLQTYAFHSFNLEVPAQVSQDCVGIWIGGAQPGFLINKLLTDIGGYNNDERKKRKDFSRSARRMSLNQIRRHLTTLNQDNFDPSSYDTKGYLLHGSIRTDGFRLQVLGFKLNELNCVKYRRLPPARLPDPITSSLGGTNHFLTEVRNVVKSKEDVKRLWNCEPHQIKVLGIDLGQTFVYGASALLPLSTESVTAANRAQEFGATEDQEILQEKQTKFVNLSVKQKAVYQPTFKHRSWMERRKRQELKEGESIAKIETELPPLCGPGAPIKAYVERLREKEEQLEEFYDNVALKKHRWNAQKARAYEYRLIANRLLEMVGGSLGAKRQSTNNVVIGIGLGDFSSRIRLSSLHGSFKSYFQQRARALGYIVVGVHEYYTSKKCPVCEEFVGQVDMRRFYCPKCKVYMHRDVMAAHNIANIVRSHLCTQQRPRYLQPRDVNGNYPWEESRESTAAIGPMTPQEIPAESGASVKRTVPVDWTEQDQNQVKRKIEE